MPPLPFPSPLHIGTDICRVARIARILRSRQCARFIQRVLAPEELARAKPVIRQVLDDAERSAACRLVAAVDGRGDGRVIKGGRPWHAPQARGSGTGGAGEVKMEGAHDERPGGKRGDSAVVDASAEQEMGAEKRIMYRRAADFMAGRFAAKEAAFKAHPHLQLGFHDILILAASDAQELVGHKVLNARSHAPPVALIRTEGDQDQMARVSISHDGEYATAVCIGFEAGQDGQGHGLDRDHGPQTGWLSRVPRLWS